MSAAAAFRVDLADASLGYGHALFATRIGVCAVAWQPQAVLALQLPEVDGQSTRARMLQELAQRLTGADVPPQADWLQAHSAAQMPECALQAVAGVQQLMAGWRAATGEAEEAEESAQHWPGAGRGRVGFATALAVLGRANPWRPARRFRL